VKIQAVSADEAPLSIDDHFPVSYAIEGAAIGVHVEVVGLLGTPTWTAAKPDYRNAIRMALTGIVELLQAGGAK
jgi:hypothetical protein